MRLATMTRICLLAALLLTIAGCGAATTAQSTAKPTVRIISPVNGAKLSSQTVTVRVSASHFTLVPGGTGQRTGTGQVWIYANGQRKTGGLGSTTTVTLAPGNYQLKAVLVTNGKVVAASAPVAVSVSPPPPLLLPPPTLPTSSCATPPLPSTGLKAGTITLFCRGLPAGGVGNDLMAGPGGDLWFTVEEFTSANATHFGIGRITPSGIITVFSQGLPTGGWPVKLVTGPDGNVWFTVNSTSANGADSIGRITPSGVITVFSHGLPAGGLAWDTQLLVGPDGDLWFPVSGGIGRITASGTITVFSHGLPAGSGAGNLVTGPGGDLWFPVRGGIGRITPSGVITVFSHGLPAGSTLGGFTTRPSGNLWFVVNGESTLAPHGGPPSLGPGLGLGRITPSGTVTIFSHGLPAGSLAGGGLTGKNQQPGPLVVGADGNLWFIVTPTQTSLEGAPQGTLGIGRITPSGAVTVFSHGLPAGGGVGNLVTGLGGDLWFPVYSNGADGIGRITPSGAITVFSHGLPAGGGVGNLVTGPGGNLWFPVYPTPTTVGGNSAIGIGRITPLGAIAVFSSPALAVGGGGAGNLVAGSDGSLWFLVPPGGGCGPATTNAIGRIVP